jgi:Fe-S cluster assembly iron-binding protein IscA
VEGGHSGMLSISSQAAEKLREELIDKCFQAKLGFRILAGGSESGEAAFNIKFDMQRQGDKVIESDGVKIFIDTFSAAQIVGCQVDYRDEPEDGFFLEMLQKTIDK